VNASTGAVPGAAPAAGGTTTRIMVQFAGEGAGTGELTWAQRGIWRTIERQGASEVMGGVAPLAPGATVDRVAASLRFIMGRHQSLRTRLRFDADGRPRQELASSGEIGLELVEAGDANPAEVAEAVHQRYERTDFDYASEWPVRMAVVTQRGVPTHAVAVYCHLAIDAHGLEVLMADLSTLDRSTGRSDTPVSGIQPLELARRQGEPATLRQGEASLRHWERLLRSIPPRRFGESADKREPRYWEIGYTSPAARLASRAIAAREDVDTTPVLLAAFAVALARTTGNNPAVIQLAVNNRFRRGFATTISPVAQTGLCAIDVAGIEFTEAIVRAGLAAIGAYKYAYYDPDERLALYARVDAERGEAVDVACYFNDRRQQDRKRAVGRVPSAEEIRAAVPLAEHRWVDRTDHPQPGLYLNVDETPQALRFTMMVDTHCLSPADITALVREVEAVAVEAALDPAATTGIPAERASGP
jgi:Condensation domain